MRLLIALLVTMCAHHVAAHADCAHNPFPLTPDFCASPPVDVVVPSSYTGTWYQVFANDAALRFSNFSCVTANYTASPTGLDVLNCFQAGPSVNCVLGAATQTPESTSRLSVQFPGSPPGPYNIAALLGDPEYGYAAAAVYSCAEFGGRTVEQWFIIARSPYHSKYTLYELLYKLRCKGYNISLSDLTPSKQGTGCSYFFGPNGFQVRTTPSGPPPSFN